MVNADNSELIKYYENCKAGKYIIGLELKLQLELLMEDIASGEYIYDTTSSKLRMDFMEKCIRLTKSPFYGKPMVLMDWQKALIEAAYSFKMPDTGFDRFQRILLLIARKNTKSELTSALGLTEFCIGPSGADIVCSSNDDSQSSIVYDAMDTMRRMIDPRDQDTRKNQTCIRNLISDSKIFKLSDRTRNKEGRNIDFGICDEVHEMKTNVIIKSIEQSQSLKDNPKLWIITTEGFINDGFLDDELKKARAIITGEDDSIAAKRRLNWLYTQDSEQEIWYGNRENRLWEKSNPTLGVIKKYDYLEQQVDLARTSKSDRIFVLSKDFNLKQNGVQAWLDLQDYDYDTEFNIEEFRGGVCLGAVDLAETTDLCCAKVLFLKDNKKYIYTKYFIPEGKLETAPDVNAGAKYEQWIADGYIQLCPGNDIDLTLVADWFYSLYKDYDIKLYKCGYDQKFSKTWINKMNEYGYTKEGKDLELINQNAETLNNAIKLVELDLKHKGIMYGNNPVDKWCFSNSSLLVNKAGQCLVVKNDNQHKIDGTVTLVILYEMFRRYRSDLVAIVNQ